MTDKTQQAIEALRKCREQIQEYADVLSKEGYVTPWRDEMIEADDMAEIAILNLQALQKTGCGC